MQGKIDYVNAILKLSGYLTKTSPEIQAIEAEMEAIHAISGVVDERLHDRLFAAKAKVMSQLIDELETGVKYLPAKELQ